MSLRSFVLFDNPMEPPMHRVLSVFALVVFAAACGTSDPQTPDAGGTDAGNGADGADGGNGNGAGSVHEGEITASQTWLEKDNPHLVKDEVFVGGSGSPVLTIEAGVVVKFAAGAFIEVGPNSEAGALIVNGMVDKPVRFVADGALASPGFYGGIRFNSAATTASSLTYLEMENCGAEWGSYVGACIGAYGPVRPKLDHVRIISSSSRGVALEGGSSFGAGSSTLTVESTVDESLLLTDANAAAGIPAGSALPKGIRLGNDKEIGKTQTWANHGAPYLIDDDLFVRGGSTPILTIAAGTELRFGSQGTLVVGDADAGGLNAEGTETDKIVFTTESAVPVAGQWAGLRFGKKAASTSKLTHAVVEYGGGYIGAPYAVANIQVEKDIGPFIKNTLVRESEGCGIVRGGDTFATDFTLAALGNVFQNNKEGDQCDD